MNFSFHSIKSALLALTGLAATALSVQAVPVAAPAPGDIFLAVRATSGQGSGTSYIVKLGTHTLFTNTTPSASFVVTGTGNIAADLEDLYGSEWASRSNVLWS